MKFSLLIVLLWCCGCLQAQVRYEFNPTCTKAYHDALSLKLDMAKEALEAEKKRDPDNLAIYFIENYIDFFILFLNEDPAELKKRVDNWDSRLDMMDRAPDSSPLKLFSKAIINMQWAVVEIKFGNRWSAGWAFRDAFKMAKENQQKFPSFTPNYMITGPMQMAASTIPQGYRWLSNLLGIKGTMEQGRQHLQTFINAKDAWANLFMEEGYFYKCYTQFYLLNQPEEALQFISAKKLDIVNNHLFTYMAANLSLNNKQSSQCRAIVEARNKSGEYLKTGIWDFELGFARLNHLDSDANVYLERFLANFKGHIYVKEVWMKLANYYLLQNNMPQYKRCVQNTIKYGSTMVDADKRALKEAQSNRLPNTTLLKARLLNDGGYHREALGILAGLSSNDFDKDEEKLEFMYRVGRIYDDLDRAEDALKAYQATINFGRHRTEYFAARAALQMGMLYENQGNKARALEFYRQCIDMKDHDYKDSLDQKAKAGISRCS